MLDLEIVDERTFTINDKRFYVFYQNKPDPGISLLNSNFFEVEETDIGYKIKIKKRGCYVGLSVPVSDRLLIGNKPFYTNEFNNQLFCFKKREHRDFYAFDSFSYTDLTVPIFHLINQKTNDAISVSPTSGEEVVVEPTMRSFEPHVKIQTYAHHENDFVDFYIDKSTNYLLNLHRVSDREVDSKFYVGDNLFNTPYSKQMAILQNKTLERREVDSKKERVVAKKVQSFFDDSDVMSVLVDNLSLNLNGLNVDPENIVRFVIPNRKQKEIYRLKNKIINSFDNVRWSEYDYIEGSQSIYFRFILDGVEVVVDFYDFNNVFFEKDSLDESNISESGDLVFSKLKSELIRGVFKNLSAQTQSTSKEQDIQRFQTISKLAWTVKRNNEIDERFFKNKYLLSKFFSRDYFDDKKFFYISKQLKDVERAYVDFRINHPLFMNLYEASSYYYIVVVNTGDYKSDGRIVTKKGVSLDKWIPFEKVGKFEGVKRPEITNYSSHSEIDLFDVRLGGILKIKK